MKKNVVIILLLIIILGMGGYLIYDKVFNKDKCDVDAISDEVENEYLGRYVVEYSENASEDVKGNAKSILTLNEDGFVFDANMCAGMMKITGDYEISNDIIKLYNFETTSMDTLEVNLRGEENLEFTINSDDEIYLNNERFGCVISGKANGSFIK